ncbi:MAG: T9SS type A sorting domain-containing protein [Ignavibacteria bacterium]|nr:T9SS type A sorting domain-containing protein [Ignavibacteria bacterium]
MKNFIFTILFITNLMFAQSVVINKFFNSGQSNGLNDAVELLVIENNLNLRGMILKDFSSSMGGDNGGRYQFRDIDLWSKLPKGTLIVIRVSNQTNDVDTSDYLIDVGLRDTLYFQQLGSGTFDIASTELVMIKAAGSEPAGVSGCIHAFGSGAAGTYFNQAPEPKLRSSGTTGTGKFAFAKNSNSQLTDFNGLDADTSSTLILGQPNNQTNALFINSLRGTQTNVEKNQFLLKDFELFNNYPNPFNPSTIIAFNLNKDTDVELSVYNLIGTKIKTILHGFYKSGYYEISFDGSGLSSGIYIYRLKTNYGTISKKMILIK